MRVCPAGAFVTRCQRRGAWTGGIIGWVVLGISGYYAGGKWLVLWVPGAIVGSCLGYKRVAAQGR